MGSPIGGSIMAGIGTGLLLELVYPLGHGIVHGVGWLIYAALTALLAWGVWGLIYATNIGLRSRR